MIDFYVQCIRKMQSIDLSVAVDVSSRNDDE